MCPEKTFCSYPGYFCRLPTTTTGQAGILCSTMDTMGKGLSVNVAEGLNNFVE